MITKFHPRLIALAIALLVASLTLPASGAGAKDETAWDSEAPASVYMANGYGIPMAEAEYRLGTLQPAIGRLNRGLTKTFPANLGGLWLDQANGGVVRILVTDREDEVRRFARKSAVPEDRIVLEQVPHSLMELMSTKEEVSSLWRTGHLGDEKSIWGLD